MAIEKKQIFFLTAFILLTELLLIRLLSTEINIFAYLQNSILVACFLGLGMGLLSSRKTTKFSKCLLPFSLLIVLCVVPYFRSALGNLSLMLSGLHDFPVWNSLSLGSFSSWMSLVGILGTLVVLFIVWSFMVPLGEALGSLLDRSEDVLTAYSVDIAGSLFGVALFALLSWSFAPPVMWAITALLLFLLVAQYDEPASLKKNTLASLLIVVIALVGPQFDQAAITSWTPYQKIELFPSKEDSDEWLVKTNNTGLQAMQNNGPLFLERHPELKKLGLPRHSQYDIPATLYPHAKEVLIVGAGTGNDVAGILRNLPQAQITAVELDPGLVGFGQKYHPERPYESAQVNLIIDDARAFFNGSQKKFDLIIFGLLDSHTTPNLSNARLDNFVYTLESLAEAARLLKKDGLLCLIFDPQRAYIASRLSNSLEKIFSQVPIMFHIPFSDVGWGGTAFISGNHQRVNEILQHNESLNFFIEEQKVKLPDNHAEIKPTTDDWPYLYIEKPSIPSLFFCLGITFVLLWIVTSRLYVGKLLAPSLIDVKNLYYFSMGFAFVLVQVFCLSKAAILFGSTWFVNTIAIGGILFGILVANLLASKVQRRSVLIIAFLLILLTAHHAYLDFTFLLSISPLPRAILAGVLLGSPMILSGLTFAYMFKVDSQPSKGLGANLFGAMVGSIVQLSTFYLGIASLALLAALAYAIAFIALGKSRSLKLG